MAKDYTKYTVEGVGSNLNKARLVQKIVEHHASSSRRHLPSVFRNLV